LTQLWEPLKNCKKFLTAGSFLYSDRYNSDGTTQRIVNREQYLCSSLRFPHAIGLFLVTPQRLLFRVQRQPKKRNVFILCDYLKLVMIGGNKWQWQDRLRPQESIYRTLSIWRTVEKERQR